MLTATSMVDVPVGESPIDGYRVAASDEIPVLVPDVATRASAEPLRSLADADLVAAPDGARAARSRIAGAAFEKSPAASRAVGVRFHGSCAQHPSNAFRSDAPYPLSSLTSGRFPEINASGESAHTCPGCVMRFGAPRSTDSQSSCANRANA